MALCKVGVPWQVAWKLEPFEQVAMMVIAGEQDGNQFDWDFMRWKDDSL